MARMKQFVSACTLTAALLALAACGGQSTATVGNSGGGGTAKVGIPGGIHGCRFVIGGDEYAEHRCDVDGAALHKLSGMETFKGTLTPMAAGLHLSAEMDCGAMVDKCNQQFDAHLVNQGGTWRGEVKPRGGEGGWWLAGATFELDDSTAYGGANYGGASYGGAD
jgi:hypothetical protein